MSQILIQKPKIDKKSNSDLLLKHIPKKYFLYAEHVKGYAWGHVIEGSFFKFLPFFFECHLIEAYELDSQNIYVAVGDTEYKTKHIRKSLRRDQAPIFIISN